MTISLISYICSVYSRLSYLNPHEFNNIYSEIFSSKNTIITEQLVNIKNKKLTELFNDDVKNLNECNKIVNKVIYSKKNIYIPSDKFCFFSISTSNYSSCYICADKRSNTLMITFRGTYSLKSGLSYTNLSSVTPTLICKNQGIIIGIYKIIHEIYNSIIECVHYLEKKFIGSKPNIVTTGHSLGGACATIFSYMFNLNERKQIACVTFGAPRVFNYDFIKKYNSLIKKEKIIFYRYVTNGDPFAKLPPHIPHLTSKTFFHPDDLDKELENNSFLCKNTSKNIKCQIKNKTKKRRPHLKYHGNYLGVMYKDAADNLTNIRKEIKRNSSGDTICRLIKSNGSEIEVAFYNLQELKDNTTKKNKTKKIRKLFKFDYIKGDIYMNNKQFEHILKHMYIMKNNDLTSDNYINLLHNQPENTIKRCLK